MYAFFEYSLVELLSPILLLALEVLKWVLIAFLVWLLIVEVVFRIVRHYHHFPAPSFVGHFLASRFRKRIQGTKKIMEALHLRNGMVLLEVGCGPGTWTIDVAKRVAPDGIVHAVDIQAGMIRQLKKKMKRNRVKNIRPHVTSAYQLPLEDSTVDAVYMVTVCAEIPDKIKALREIGRVLKPKGVLSISEFLMDPDYPRRNTTMRWAGAAGFRPVASYGNFYSYTLNFQLKARKLAQCIKLEEHAEHAGT